MDNRCSFLLLCADHDLKCHESTIYNVVSKMIICIPRSAHVCHILEPSFHLQPQLQWHLRCCCLYAGWSSESEPDPSETKVSLAIYVSLFVLASECWDVVSAGGVGTFIRTYVCGTYRSQCTCASNGSREPHDVPISLTRRTHDIVGWTWVSVRAELGAVACVIRT